MKNTNTIVDLSANHPWIGRNASGICAGDLQPVSGKVVKVRHIRGNDFVNLQTNSGYVIPCRFNSIVLA